MYQQVETAKSVTLDNGSIAEPVASLKDEYGGESHIIIDDGCYVLVNMADDGGKIVSWIYPEAFEVLKTLPSPRN